MDKQKKLKIVLPLLVVVMAFVWGPVFTGSGSKKKEKESNVSSSTGADTGVSAQNNVNLMSLARSGTRKKAKTSYEDWGRNPFAVVQDLDDLALEGIVWDEEAPKAIINGNIVTVGDQIGSSVIVDIKQNSVTIRSETEETELRLGTVK